MNMKDLKDIQEILEIYTFTEGQQKVIDSFLEIYSNGFKPSEFKVSGHAGSGKTVVLSTLCKICDKLGVNYAVVTLTGKASDVLRSKGVHRAQTIHSMMYSPITDDKTGKIIKWSKSKSLEYDIIFIDEYVMVSKNILDDIRGYNKTIFMLGDVGQLTAIGTKDESVLNNLNVEMTEVLRQANDNPIIKYANMIRNGINIKNNTYEKNEHGIFMTLHREKDAETIEKLKLKVDQIICGRNATRHKINNEIREKLGYTSYLSEGEKLVILRNDKNYAVFNGQIINADKIVGVPFTDKYGFNCQEIETELGNLIICIDSLINPDFDFQEKIGINKTYLDRDYVEPVFCNSGIALTLHKCQGSGMESILFFANDLYFMKFVGGCSVEEGIKNLNRATYTGITRAIKNCFIVI